MNIIKIEENVKNIIAKVNSEELAREDFIYELLLGYGHRPQTIGRVRSGERNLADDKVNSVFWKRQIYFQIAEEQNLYDLIDQMKNEKRVETNKIRFLLVTDFQKILAVDLKTQDPLDINFIDLPKKFDFFLPWAGMEKAVYQGENPADVKAAEKLARLFDEIKADNFDENTLNDKEKLHHLNIFLSRLLFCYFAEDTGIFGDKQFSDAVGSHTKDDGSDLSNYLKRLFSVLNQSNELRSQELPDYLSEFPYVNGGLFKDNIEIPVFTKKSRRILIECGAELDWSDINPDIFGSMFQAVVNPEQREEGGQHYTSVPNIMKVIEPLILNELYELLLKHQNNLTKLLELQLYLGSLKVFDPACGSGNFLIIAYKELRRFEMELLKQVQELELINNKQITKPFSILQVSQFYGIEIDDFAGEIAVLSLWLAEHQMNQEFKVEFGESPPSLPLKVSANILIGNATRINWLEFCRYNGKESRIYLVGNPPFSGSRKRTKQQGDDLGEVFSQKDYKLLDYVSAWFYKGAEFVSLTQARLGFVSTSSITQGEQVALLWPKIFDLDVDIEWAHQSFKWKNNAKDNAAVAVVIIGLAKSSDIKRKTLYSNMFEMQVANITPNLTESVELIVPSRKVSLSNLPMMHLGNMPADGGKLLFNKTEKESLLEAEPLLEMYFKELISAREFLNGRKRYCLWFEGYNLKDLRQIPILNKILNEVEIIRRRSSRPHLAEVPHLFAQITQPMEKDFILIPRHSSENRSYIPIGFFSKDYIAHDSCLIIPDGTLDLFALLNSKMHMTWINATSGRLEERIRYSKDTVYNNFPVPELTQSEINTLSTLALEILSIREQFTTASLAELYSKDKMPNILLEAHLKIDTYVDGIYERVTKREVNSEECRLIILHSLFEDMKKDIK